MAEQIDPVTGLPSNVIKQAVDSPDSKDGIDSVTGLPISVIKSSATNPKPYSDVGVGFSGGISRNLTNIYTDPLSNYKDYDVNTNAFASNWNEQRAQNQPWYEQFGYGVAKAVTTAATSVVDGTLGTANGLLSLAFDSDHSFADNTIGQSMDAVNEKMRELLPNYYTQEEQDSLLGALSNPANFIGDKVLGGAAYTVGALATMYLTGGVGVAGGLARGASLAARVGKAAIGVEAGMSELSATYRVAKALKSGADISKGIAQAANTSRYLRLAQQTDVALTMSLSEAAIEARETKRQFIDEKTAEWEAQNPGQEMSSEVMDAIEQSATAAMNANFGINLAILAGTNALTFGHMSYRKFTGQTVKEDLASGMYKVKGTMGADGMKYAEQLSNYKLLRGLQKGQRIFGVAGKGMLFEGFQEGAQFTTNEALQQYYSDKFDGRIEGGFLDMISATAHGLSKTFSTTAGLESMLIGAIVGGGMATVTNRGVNSTKEQNTKQFLDLASTQVFSNLSERFEKTQENARLVAELQRAQESGDEATAEAARQKLIFNHAYKYDKAGALDYMFEELDDTAKLSEEEFKKKMFYDPSKPLADQTDGKSQQEVIDDIKATAKETLKLQKDILAITPLTRPTGLFAALQSEEDKKDFLLQQKIDTTYRNMLYDSALKSKIATKQANEAYNELIQLNPEFANLSKNDLLYKITAGEVSLDENGEIQVEGKRGATSLNDEKAKEDEKFEKQLEASRKAFRSLEATDQVKFTLAMQRLNSAVAVKGAAEVSFNELRKNSTNRALYVQAKQLRDQERKQRIADDQADDVIANAATTEELENAMPEDTSEAKLILARQKAKELRAQEDKAQEEFKNYSDEELEAGYSVDGKLIDEDALDEIDPVKAVAFKREKQQRRLKRELNERQAQVNPASIPFAPQPTEVQPGVEFNQAISNIKEDFIQELEDIANNAAIDKSGRRFVIQGRIYEIDSAELTDALNFDEDGNLVSVTLKDVQNNRQKVFYLTNDITNFENILEYQNQTAQEAPNIDQIIPDAIAYSILINRLQIDPTIESVEQALEQTNAEVIEEVTTTIAVEEQQKKDPNFSINNKSLDKLQEEAATLRTDKAELKAELDFVNAAINSLEPTTPASKLKELEDYKKNILELIDTIEKLEAVKHEAIRYKQGKFTETEETPIEPEINSPIIDKLLQEIEKLNNELTAYAEAKQAFDQVLKDAEAGQPISPQDVVIAQEQSNDFKDKIRKIQSKIRYRNNKINSIKEQENEIRLAELQQAGQTTSGSTVSVEGEVAERANTDSNTRATEERTDQSQQMTESEIANTKSEAEKAEAIKTATDENELILQGVQPTVQTQPLPSAPTPVVILDGSTLNIQLSKGEFEKPGRKSKGIIVTESGEAVSGNTVQQFDEDGNAIFVDTQAVTTEVNIGDTVEFVVDENTQWWQENKDNYPVEDHWKHVPIFVVHNGKKVALVSAYKQEDNNGIIEIYGTDRKVIFDNRANRPTAVVNAKMFDTTNISNATTRTGQNVFYNASDLIKQGGIGIVTNEGIEVVYAPNMTEEEINNATQVVIKDEETGKSKLVPGQVVVFGRNPLGGIQTFAASTKQLDELGITTVLDAIKDGNFSYVPEIVGAEIVLEEFISADLDTYTEAAKENMENFMFFEVFSNQLLFTFYSPSAKSLIRVGAEQMKNSLTSGKDITFSFVDIVPAQKEGTSGFDIVINKDRKNHSEVQSKIIEEFKTVLASKKYQVSKSILKQVTGPYTSKLNLDGQPTTYVEYLTNALPGARTQGLGHNAILSVDIRLNDNGSAFHDVGLGFGRIQVQDGSVTFKTKEETESVTVPEVAPTEVAIPTTVDVAPTLIDDLFDSAEFAEFMGVTPELPAATPISTTTKADVNSLIDKRTIENELTNGNYSFYPTEEAAEQNKGIVITKNNVNQAIEAEKKLGDVIYDNKLKVITGIPSSIIYIELSPGSSTEFLDAKDLEDFINNPKEDAKEREVAKKKYDELVALVNNTQPISTEAKVNIKGNLAAQGTSVELEIVGDTGKEFLLTVDRKGNISLFSEKQPNGSYKSGEPAPKEAVINLYKKYVPSNTILKIQKWVAAFNGSWAASETEDGKKYDKAEKELITELTALGQSTTQPVSQPEVQSNLVDVGVPSEFAGLFTTARQMSSEDLQKMKDEMQSNAADELTLNGIISNPDNPIRSTEEEGEKINKKCKNG